MRHPIVGLLLVKKHKSAINLVCCGMCEHCLYSQCNVRCRPASYEAGLVRVNDPGQHLRHPISQDLREDLGVTVGESDRPPVAKRRMITVGLRNKGQRRGEPRCWRSLTTKNAVKEVEEDRGEDREIGTVPLVRKTIRARRLPERELAHHAREFCFRDGS
jgi:hypothetical protein